MTCTPLWLQDDCTDGTETILLQNLSGGTQTLPSMKVAIGQQALSMQALRKQLDPPRGAAQSQPGCATPQPRSITGR